MPSILNRLPIFTNIGFAKVQAAIQNSTKVTLSQIALGDAINNIDYDLSPTMTALNHELMRINVRSLTIDDTTFFETLVLRVLGTLVAKNAIDMVIREIGIYDNTGDLIIITRTNNVTTMSPESLRTGVELDIGKKIDANARDVFAVDYTNNTDGVLRYELTAHIAQDIDPHRTTKFQVGLGNVENVADEDMALSNNLLELIMDSEIATGFVDINNSVLSIDGTVLTLNNILANDVYRRGILFTLPVGAINIDLATEYGEYYIGLNPVLNTLYRINTLDIVNDIPVAFVSVNSIDGIVIYTDERHSASKNNEWYQLEEKSNSISMVNGGKLAGLVGDVNNVSISISAPVRVFNKDLDFTVVDTSIVGEYNQVLTNAKIPVMYIGVGNIIRESRTDLATGPWLYNINGLLVNDITTGLLNELGNNKYINYYLVITADIKAPIKLVIGHKEHLTLDAAMSEDKDENAILGRINILEVYRITLKKDNTIIANVFKATIESIVLLLPKTGLRNAFTAKSHNDLGSSRFEPNQHGIDNFLGLRAALDAASGDVESQEGILSIDFNGNLQSDLSVFTGTGATIETRQADRRKIPTVYGGGGGDELLKGEYIGTDYGTGGGKWSGGALAANGKIYCPPSVGYGQVLMIDPSTDITSLIGTNYGVTAYTKWLGGAVAPNGMIYCAPWGANYVLKINPITNTTTLIGTDYGTNGARWSGGALAANGKIYCPPATANQVLCIDPVTDTTSLIGTNYGTGAGKYRGAILAPNGMIYCAPTAASQILKIDPDTNTTVLIGTDYGLAIDKWIGGILHPNGKIYFPPAGAAQVLVLDPSTDTTTLIGPSFSTSVTKWDSACVGPDGRIYCIPATINQVLIIDPITNTVKLALKDYGSADTKWVGIYSADNGKMYALPYNSNYVLKLDFMDKTKNYSPIATRLIGTDYGSNVRNRWSSGTLALNGKIYCAPYEDAETLIIDPSSGTTALMGNAGIGAGKWGEGVLAPNGKIYCAPQYTAASQVLVIDTKTDTQTVIGSNYGTGTQKWYGACLAPNGKIYCPPHISSQVLVIDPYTNTTSLVGTDYGTSAGKWAGACLAANGMIYCAPWGANYVLKINPITNTTSLIGTDYGTTNAKWYGGVLAPNGMIYCPPVTMTKVLKINPNDNTTSLVGSYLGTLSSKWYSGTLHPNGKIYFYPAIGASKQILEIDPETDTTRLITVPDYNSTVTGVKYSGITLGPNGKLYGAPMQAGRVIEIDIPDRSTDFGAYLKITIDPNKIVP